MKTVLIKIFFLLFLYLLGFNCNAQIPQLVKDISPGSGDCMIGNSIAYHGKLIFTANPGSLIPDCRELWITDGTSAGTQLIKRFDLWTGGYGFTLLNDKLYFAATDTTHGEELWVTDGTAAGTHMVLDIWPGARGGLSGINNTVNMFAILGGKLFFVANDGVHGPELWVSDGSASGSMMVADVNPAATLSSAEGEVLSVNGMLYFPEDDGVHGMEMWTSDGTVAGTHLIKDLDVIGSDTSYIYNLIPFNNRVYFTESMSYPSVSKRYPSSNFCVTDGTADGTQVLDTALANSVDYAIMGNKLYFYGNTDLWATDGTAAGTQMIMTPLNTMCSGNNSFKPNSITTFNNHLFFENSGPTWVYQSQLWTSDSTAANTQKLLVPASNTTSSIVTYHLTPTNHYLFFTGWDNATSQWNLWRSDGTERGTGIVAFPEVNTFFNFVDCDHGLSHPTLVNGILYFGIEYDTNIGFELYKLEVNLGVEETNGFKNDLEISPNPAQNRLTISATYPVYSVSVCNLLGQVIFTQQNNSDKVEIKTADLPPAVYLLRVNGSVVRRFVKE